MARDKPHDWEDIETEFEGETVKGSYYVEGGMVTVSTTWGDRKSAQAGSTPPKAMALRLLRELAEAGKA